MLKKERGLREVEKLILSVCSPAHSSKNIPVCGLRGTKSRQMKLVKLEREKESKRVKKRERQRQREQEKEEKRVSEREREKRV